VIEILYVSKDSVNWHLLAMSVKLWHSIPSLGRRVSSTRGDTTRSCLPALVDLVVCWVHAVRAPTVGLHSGMSPQSHGVIAVTGQIFTIIPKIVHV